MPTILFLISLIIASSMFLSINRIVQDNAVSRALIESGAAFYTADSDGEQLELNQGIESSLIEREISFQQKSFVDPFFLSGMEVFLHEVLPDEQVDSIVVDYCGKGEADCPELFVEWFRLGQGFSFHSLENLKNKKNEPGEIDRCLDLPEIKVRRCIAGSKDGSMEPLYFRASDDDSFRKSFKLNTDLASYHYRLRFWSEDRDPFEFQIYGLTNGQRVGLPGLFEEEDRLARAGNSHRRIRRQEWSSGGLQDGLNFVHYSKELSEK